MQGVTCFLSGVVIGINMFFVAECVVSFDLTHLYNINIYVIYDLRYINFQANLREVRLLRIICPK